MCSDMEERILMGKGKKVHFANSFGGFRPPSFVEAAQPWLTENSGAMTFSSMETPSTTLSRSKSSYMLLRLSLRI